MQSTLSSSLLLAAAAIVSLTNAVDVPLGACGDFSLKASTAMTFNGGLTTVGTGNIGVSPGNILSGSFIVSKGQIEMLTPAAIQCDTDHLISYGILVSQPCPAANIYAELAGLTLAPGVYCSGSEMKFSASTLTLDGQNQQTPQWIFQIATALTTAPTTHFILQNGARTENVYWAIGSSATIGYSSSFIGNIFANKAVTFGTGSVLEGRALAFTGISFQSGSTVVLPLNAPTSRRTDSAMEIAALPPAGLPLVLGDCAAFAVLGGTAVSFNGVKTIINKGSVGVSPGNQISGSYQIVAGTQENNTPLAKSCAASLDTMFTMASTAHCSANHTLQAADLAGVVLTPGVYCSAPGKFVLSAATVTLDAGGNPNAQWVFQTVSTLTTSTATSFKLLNGAQASNVFWAIGTSASLGYSSNFVGTILAQAAINYGTGVNVVGRGLAMTAITFESQGVIEIPTIPTVSK